jgi:hypothetical protein
MRQELRTSLVALRVQQADQREKQMSLVQQHQSGQDHFSRSGEDVEKKLMRKVMPGPDCEKPAMGLWPLPSTPSYPAQ